MSRTGVTRSRDRARAGQNSPHRQQLQQLMTTMAAFAAAAGPPVPAPAARSRLSARRAPPDGPAASSRRFQAGRGGGGSSFSPNTQPGSTASRLLCPGADRSAGPGHVAARRVSAGSGRLRRGRSSRGAEPRGRQLLGTRCAGASSLCASAGVSAPVVAGVKASLCLCSFLFLQRCGFKGNQKSVTKLCTVVRTVQETLSLIHPTSVSYLLLLCLYCYQPLCSLSISCAVLPHFSFCMFLSRNPPAIFPVMLTNAIARMAAEKFRAPKSLLGCANGSFVCGF